MIKKLFAIIASLVLVVSLVALPSLAYTANPDDNIIGYNLLANIRLGHSYDDVTTLDTLPYSVNDPRDFYSDTYELVIDDDEYFEVFFIENIGEFTVNIPPLIYQPARDYNMFVIACRSATIHYDAYNASGVYLGGDTILIPSDNTREINVTSLLDGVLPSNCDRVYLTITDVVADERFYLDLPLIPTGTLVSDCAYRMQSNDDIIVKNTISSVPVGDFLWDSVSGFLTFEIAPNLQLYHVLLAVVVLPLLVWFLKVVAGG